MALPFDTAPPPTLLNHWERKAEQFARGLTVFRSDQCPYIDDAVKTVLATADKRNIESRVVELKTSEDVKSLAPSPYGVFSIVYNGKLLSPHYLLEKELLQRLEKLSGQ